jgi:hypothetical protein
VRLFLVEDRQFGEPVSFVPGGIFLILLIYVVIAALVGFVIYLAVRFAVRDGLRGHQLWLERTRRGPEQDRDSGHAKP